MTAASDAMTDDTLVSTGYVARHLGCSVTALKNWERDGTLPSTRRLIGARREWRVWPVSDLPMIEERVGHLVRGPGRPRVRADDKEAEAT
ncbi:MAG: hypothetical protein M3Q10_09310 [Chloroflexota bacterium]|nr:hypothetical protein [Chloroflexota bacterium]